LEASTSSNESLQILIKISDCNQFDESEFPEAIKKLSEFFRNDKESAVRAKVLSLFSELAAETNIECTMLIDEVVLLLKNEKSSKVLSPGLHILHKIAINESLPVGHVNKIVFFAKKQLTSPSHNVQRYALMLLGSFSLLGDAEKEGLDLVGKYTDSPDARVRAHAFRAILILGKRGVQLGPSLYPRAVDSLKDDYDCVRQEALQLVFELGIRHPEQ
jgi:integrator complex subunit 4